MVEFNWAKFKCLKQAGCELSKFDCEEAISTLRPSLKCILSSSTSVSSSNLENVQQFPVFGITITIIMTFNAKLSWVFQNVWNLAFSQRSTDPNPRYFQCDIYLTIAFGKKIFREPKPMLRKFFFNIYEIWKVDRWPTNIANWNRQITGRTQANMHDRLFCF